MIPAKVVDPGVLEKLVGGAFVAGIVVTAAFGVVIYGSTRFADLRRRGNAVGAAFFGLLATLALIVFAASVVLGVTIMAHTS